MMKKLWIITLLGLASIGSTSLIRKIKLNKKNNFYEELRKNNIFFT